MPNTDTDLPELEEQRDEAPNTEHSRKSRPLLQIPTRKRYVDRAISTREFPTPAESASKAQVGKSNHRSFNPASLPPTNCNMYQSLQYRESVAEVRASATRKLNSPAHSGRLSRKTKWVARIDIHSSIFQMEPHDSMRSFNRIPRFPPNSAPKSSLVPNYVALYRPRHAYLNKKARANHKYYG